MSAGLVRVYSFDDNRAWVAEMQIFKWDARAARREIWALDYCWLRSFEGNRVGGKFKSAKDRKIRATHRERMEALK